MGILQNNMQSQQEGIDLRELVIAIWKQRILIISITLITAILTGAFSIFLVTPVYKSNLNIVINMPATYHTKYGDYAMPITSNKEYISLITSNDVLINTIKDMGYDAEKVTIDGLRARIILNTVNSPVELNSFNIKVAANNPEEARNLAQALFDNYVEFMDVLIAKGAMNYYKNDYTIGLKSLNKSLETTQKILTNNEELLAETLPTINQKEAMQEIQNQNSEFVVLENIINPNYTAIENNIIDNKQTINDIENTIRVYGEYLAEFDLQNDIFKKYKENGQFEELESNIVSATKTNVYLPSAPVAPSQKVNSGTAKNIIIGALLGGIIGVTIGLMKEYWFQKA